MCGLVSVISKNKTGFNKTQQDVFGTLLFIDLLRGMDSTGMFVVENDGSIFVAKEASNSLDFLQTKEYEQGDRTAFARGMAMVGHNRKATLGTVNDENAHPFNVDNNIILVHNGTMLSDHKRFADVEVDSHAIAHLIHNKDSIGEALSAFHGAYALIWYDVEDATIRMIRNDQRPLWWMETSDSWIWASTPDMLEFVRHRHSLKLVQEPTLLPEDLLQEYKLLEDRTWDVSNEKVEIKRMYPMYTPTYEVGGGRKNHNHFFYENEPDAELQEYVRQTYGKPAEKTEHRPQQQHPTHGQGHASGGREIKEPVEFAGLQAHQRKIASDSRNIMPYGEFQERILNRGQYYWDSRVHAVPFDYGYVNGLDSSDGYYIYASPVSGDSVILRHFLSNEQIDENRVLQICSGGYVYEYLIGTKAWYNLQPMETSANGHVRNDAPGFVIIKARQATMLMNPQENKQMH